MDDKAQKVCDLINNAIDEVRRCRLMVDKAAPKHKVKAQLNSDRASAPEGIGYGWRG